MNKILTTAFLQSDSLNGANVFLLFKGGWSLIVNSLSFSSGLRLTKLIKEC